MKLSLRHCKVDMKYEDFKKVATNTVYLNDDDEESEVASPPDDILTANELKCLKSISLERKKDSTFVLDAMRCVYKNVSVLSNKTLKGTPQHTEFKDDGTAIVHPSKSPLTPEKVTKVEQLFIDCVTRSKTGVVDQGERIKQSNINKLFASAISNLSKPFKSRGQTSNVEILEE